MAGFKEASYNTNFAVGYLESIIEHLIKCSARMKADCVNTGKKLKNHEDRITDRLVAKYLNNETSIFRFTPQSPETFDAGKDSYEGRTDIKVVTKDWFSNADMYFVVECKRIDGSSDLNRKYITEGVARFVNNPPKYSSYYGRNIMFGYIVQNINVPQNTSKINGLQRTLLNGVVCSTISLVSCKAPEHYIYSCQYGMTPGCIELRHLLYNFADAI